MKAAFPNQGLYAITPDGLADEALLNAAEQALQGGATALQFRDKQRNAFQKIALADSLRALCHRFRVPLIINDDAKLAADCGADGVHLGRDDGSIEQARDALGDAAIIGVSCYGELERARWAQAQGASYVAFGRCFPSNTKPDAPAFDLRVLQQAQREISIPKVVIGGITIANAAGLIAAGADVIACVDGVFGGLHIEQNATQLSQLFSTNHG